MNTTVKLIRYSAFFLLAGVFSSMNATGSTINHLTSTHGANSISGSLYYANPIPAGMKNSSVQLADQYGNIIATSNTDTYGAYSFTGLADGTYTLIPATTLPWGGGNATDALDIELNFAGFMNLSGLSLIAADVYNSGYINSMDALAVMRRFVGYDQAFSTRPDFYLGNQHVTVSGGVDYTQNLFAICYGDVDGSYNLSNVSRTAPDVSLFNNHSLACNQGDIIDIPVSLKDKNSLGAISLSLGFAADQLEIMDVTANSGKGTLLYLVNNGELRVSWLSTEPLIVNGADDVVLIIKARVLNTDFSAFSLGNETEIADGNAHVLGNQELLMPSLKVISGSNLSVEDTHALTISPNPVTSNANIILQSDVDQAATIQLLNLCGQKVYEKNIHLTSGVNSTSIAMSDLPAGLYVVALWAGNNRLETKKLIKN